MGNPISPNVFCPTIASRCRNNTHGYGLRVGVDIAVDIFKDEILDIIRVHDPGSIICANILGQVEDPKGLAKLFVDLLRKDGVIFVSVPYDFPWLLAPIENRFRPSPMELSAIFPDSKMLAGSILTAETFGFQLILSPMRLIKHLLRTLFPWPTVYH